MPSTSLYVHDRHRLIVIVSNGALTARIECPNPENGARCRDEDGCCCVQRELAAVGLEFIEWQERPYRAADLPVEIEWAVFGEGDTYEFFWRPVDGLGLRATG